MNHFSFLFLNFWQSILKQSTECLLLKIPLSKYCVSVYECSRLERALSLVTYAICIHTSLGEIVNKLQAIYSFANIACVRARLYLDTCGKHTRSKFDSSSVRVPQTNTHVHQTPINSHNTTPPGGSTRYGDSQTCYFTRLRPSVSFFVALTKRLGSSTENSNEHSRVSPATSTNTSC